MKERKDGIYKISSGGSAAIIRKSNNSLILITFRGFKDFEKKDILKINIKHQKDRVFTKDVNGRYRVCGDIEWAELSSIVTLRTKVMDKYILPLTSPIISFKKTEDLKELFYFENGHWVLKDFEKRKNGIEVYRVNFKNKLVVCGELINGLLSLNYNLQGKYKIAVHSYKKTEEDNSRFIHFDNNSNLWMLNDFERHNSTNIHKRKF